MSHTERIEYQIGVGYCANWTMVDAIREIIANAIDAGNPGTDRHLRLQAVLACMSELVYPVEWARIQP